MLDIFSMNCIMFTKKEIKHKKDIKKFDYTKFTLTGGYLYKSEKRKDKLIKSLIKRTVQKTNRRWCEKINDLIIKEEMSINRQLFQKYFNFQMPSAMLYTVYYTYSKRNNDLVNVIKSRLSDLKDEI